MSIAPLLDMLLEELGILLLVYNLIQDFVNPFKFQSNEDFPLFFFKTHIAVFCLLQH